MRPRARATSQWRASRRVQPVRIRPGRRRPVIWLVTCLACGQSHADHSRKTATITRVARGMTARPVVPRSCINASGLELGAFFSDCGTMILTANMRLWTADTGRAIGGNLRGQDRNWNARGHRLAGNDAGHLCICDLSRGDEVANVPADAIRSRHMTPSGLCLSSTRARSQSGGTATRRGDQSRADDAVGCGGGPCHHVGGASPKGYRRDRASICALAVEDKDCQSAAPRRPCRRIDQVHPTANR